MMQHIDRRLRASLLAIMAAVAGSVAGCSVHIVAGPIPAATLQPSDFGPATPAVGGFLQGTHFRVMPPTAWVSGANSPIIAGNTNVEVALKQPPVTRSEPTLVVTVEDAPQDLPVQAYADILRGNDLHDKSGGGVVAAGGMQSFTLDGELAQRYVTRSRQATGGVTYEYIVVYNGGLVYILDLAAPTPLFAAASAGPYSKFLASWRWD